MHPATTLPLRWLTLHAQATPQEPTRDQKQPSALVAAPLPRSPATRLAAPHSPKLIDQKEQLQCEFAHHQSRAHAHHLGGHGFRRQHRSPQTQHEHPSATQLPARHSSGAPPHRPGHGTNNTRTSYP